MDAVNFIKERTRMCKSFGDKCEECPLLMPAKMNYVLVQLT